MVMVLAEKDLGEYIAEVKDGDSPLDPKKDIKALAAICLAVEDDQLLYVRGAKTAKQAWESLQKQYETPVLANKIFTKRYGSSTLSGIIFGSSAVRWYLRIHFVGSCIRGALSAFIWDMHRIQNGNDSMT